MRIEHLYDLTCIKHYAHSAYCHFFYLAVFFIICSSQFTVSPYSFSANAANSLREQPTGTRAFMSPTERQHTLFMPANDIMSSSFSHFSLSLSLSPSLSLSLSLCSRLSLLRQSEYGINLLSDRGKLFFLLTEEKRRKKRRGKQSRPLSA